MKALWKIIRCIMFGLYLTFGLMFLMTIIAGSFRCIDCIFTAMDPGVFDIICLGLMLLFAFVFGVVLWYVELDDDP